jgi:SAM-dependent methyltransferase
MLNQHQTIRDNIAKFNKSNPLAEYLIPFLGNKREVRIADLGSGPYSIIGDHLGNRDIQLYLMDNQDFRGFWEQYKATPYYPVFRFDMEDIPFRDSTFDLVTCINALDHTDDAYKAVQEMIRICKPGGWIYIDCHLDQKETGHKHKWNANKYGTFSNDDTFFSLSNLGFTIEYIDNGGESRYNKIIATLQKGGENK